MRERLAKEKFGTLIEIPGSRFVGIVIYALARKCNTHFKLQMRSLKHLLTVG